MTVKCTNGHIFEATGPYEACPVCYSLGGPYDPEPEEDSSFVQSTVLEDLAESSLLGSAMSAATETATASVSEGMGSGFDGFGGGDSGGGGASDSFDGGSSDTSSSDMNSGSD